MSKRHNRWSREADCRHSSSTSEWGSWSRHLYQSSWQESLLPTNCRWWEQMNWVMAKNSHPREGRDELLWILLHLLTTLSNLFLSLSLSLPFFLSGTLQVHVVKSIFPRSIFNTFVLPLSILRQLSLVIQLLISLFLFNYPSTFPRFLHPLLSSCSPLQSFDLFFVDQLSTGVPLLKMIGWTRTVFYCHYPDKEVGNSIAKERAIARGEGGPSILRSLYRIPLDILEEVTTSE